MSFNYYPYCFYQYRDESTNTYKSYLSLSSKETPQCFGMGNSWVKKGTFYSINPSLANKPDGLKTIAFSQNKGRKNIQDVSIIDNIFLDQYKETIDTTTTIITAWTKPLPNLTPLYLHSIQNNIFLSWNPLPPPLDKDSDITSKKDNRNKDSKTFEIIISPIYVLSTDVFGNNPNNIKFQCIDNNIIPYTKDISNLFYKTKFKHALPINQAILECNQNNNTKPGNLLDTITKNTLSLRKNTSNINPVVISIIISVFFLSTILLVYLVLK
jgi:hypothetical protein